MLRSPPRILSRFFRRPLSRLAGVLFLFAALNPSPASYAQQVSDERDGGDRILHEYFDPWGVNIFSAASGSAAQSDGEGDTESSPAAQSASSQGQPPGLSLGQDPDEMIFGQGGPVDPGETSTPWGPLEPGASTSRLDDATDRVDELKYWANFEPSVVPYKRVVVQNQVVESGGTYAMSLRAGRFQEVPVDPRPASEQEDIFWGSFLVRTDAGARHPIPSVSPEQRVLKLEVAPSAQVRLVRDEADNFYIVPDTDELLRINMQIAVPRSYFTSDLRQAVSWSSFSAKRGSPDIRLGAQVRQVAGNVLKMSGASRQMDPREALWALVDYYRDFQARPFPESARGEDLYMSISREQIGVCRHRSLAFVISARALGIPARYIYNEAHAFVEVWWPGIGWRRIDLGGAADEVDFSGRNDAAVHQTDEDPLPRPENYMSELERIAGSVPGADRALSDAQAGDAGEESAEEDAPHGADEASMSVDDEPAEGDGLDGAQVHAGDGQQAERFEPSGQLATPGAEEARKPVRIDAVASADEIFLGNKIGVSGSIFTQAGRPVQRAGLQVYLGPPGAEKTDGLKLLGTMESDPGGRFEGEFSLPEDISIGRWRIIVRFDGDDEYQPAQVN